MEEGTREKYAIKTNVMVLLLHFYPTFLIFYLKSEVYVLG